MGWTEVALRVRYAETDRMGYVYYAHLLVWFEVARSEWCRERGARYLDLEKAGLFLPVVEAFVRYRHPVTYDEEVLIRVRLAKKKASMVKFEYEVVRREGDLMVAAGHTWHILMDSARKRVPLPDWFEEDAGRAGGFPDG